MRLRKILPFLCLILLGMFPRLSLADPSQTTIWDFDEDVTSVVPHEDGFIVLAGTQLWFCDPSLEQPETPLLFENDSLRQMLSDGQGNLYAFADMMHQGAWSNVLAEVSLSTQTLTPMLVLDNLPRDVYKRQALALLMASSIVMEPFTSPWGLTICACAIFEMQLPIKRTTAKQTGTKNRAIFFTGFASV